jgi:hypothetical protein
MSGDLQFLNLAGPDRDVRASRVRSRTTRDDNKVRNCLSFTIPHELDDNEAKRSRVRHLRICNKIADRLRAEGFEVGKPRPAKPWGAAFSIKLDGLTVVAMLVASRLPCFVKCDVLTWTRPSRWRRIPSQVVASEWERTRTAIEKVVRQDLKADSPQWLTENELVDQEEAGDSPSPPSRT